MTDLLPKLAVWRTQVASSDRQMAVNRGTAGLLVVTFNFWAHQRGWLPELPLLGPALYLALGGLLALALLVRPAPSPRRRLAALVLDCGAVSYELHIGGGAVAWLFAGYLWVIFGNGFRFGSRFQGYAMLAATAGFGAMAALTPFWRSQPALIIGVLISLAVVPLYALALIKRLSQARQQAEEANRAKSMFLASVSHELRTPLNAVIGMGALLESSELNPDQVQMSQTIMTSARSLLSMIDGILDLSRIEAGRMSVTPSDFDLGRQLNEIRTVFVAQGRLKGVRLNLHVTARTPLALHGDAGKLHEILLNLVGNAMKFTAAGNITVAVDAIARQDAAARLRFEVTDTGIGIAPEAHERIFETFTQADETIASRFGGTGLGLALVRKSVQLLGGEIGLRSAPGAGSTFWFELPLQCQQAAAETSERFPNLRAFVLARRSGAVAPLLGRLTECGVRVEHVEAVLPDWPDAAETPASCVLAFHLPEPGAAPRRFEALHAAGALTFVEVRARGEAAGLPDAATQRRYASRLALPVTEAELHNLLRFITATAGQGSPPAEPAPEPAARISRHLLVADDNATNRYVLEMILRSAGHTVTLVNNGEEVLDALAEHDFDAAVLDVNMPVMDGIETTKIYRMTALGGASAIPMIALTADATPATSDRCLEAGMAACLIKPVEPARLLSLIDAVTGAGAQNPPAPPANPRVTEIAKHPRFRGNLPAAVEAEVLANLRNLGGAAFVVDVADSFRGEARAALQALRAAAAQGDVPAFRAQAHALRSVAANVGARHLAEICLPHQTVAAADLRARSGAWLEQIETELGRVEAALAEYGAGPATHSAR